METIVEDRENLNDFLEEAELQQYYELFRDILKVTKVSQLKFVIVEDLVQIGLSKPEQRRYKKIYSKYFPNPYLSRIKKLLVPNKKHDPFSLGHVPVPIELQPFSENSVKLPTKHIISIEDITINKELGMGQFGVVQQGTWNTGNQRLQVAIKCLGQERMTSNSTEFLKEAAVMHSIDHPNIVRLYGVVLHMDSLMLVTELAPLRSLLECLREVSLRPNFSVPNLCDFAEQICDGMTYLESKRLIHRDLAARNILVFNKDRVKISDFGLSRALGVGKDYYQTNYNVNLKLPVAWCAPECILYLRFTSSSDVWAYGVCLWEMFTYGFQPWAAFSGQQILETIDAPNFQRLEKPECCPEAYYSTMLECWSHDPSNRPKFKELGQKLRSVRPEMVQATIDFQKPEDGRRCNFLEYKTGDIITVLGRESITKTALWYGVLPGGACGMFDPSQTKPYAKPDKALGAGVSPQPARNSSRALRSALLRSDATRHTYHSNKRPIQRSMISSPQGDVKHTGHVGLDGAFFGDISFLDPAGCPPRQVVSPYKPSEDLEQVPLINPNSPSHLSGASCTPPYPLLSPNKLHTKSDCEEIDLPCETKIKSLKKISHRSSSEPTTGKSILNRVKCATLGRGHRGNGDGASSKNDEVHEYHEISDTDTEGNATDTRAESLTQPESPGIAKNYADFSQSLLDEMESMFRSLDGRRRDESGLSGKHQDNDAVTRSHTLSKAEKKKVNQTGTMRMMSAHDEKTLDAAVALANEITTKSMTDLEGEQRVPKSPSDRSKFQFKFPLVSLHHHATNETEKEHTGKPERRNFSEEANSVPDIQSTITEESKLAYTSLIEEPTPSTSLISQISHDTSGLIISKDLRGFTISKDTSGVMMSKGTGCVAIPATVPKSEFRAKPKPQFHTLQIPMPPRHRPQVAAEDDGREFKKDASIRSSRNNVADGRIPAINVLPLPPRTSKTKLINRPRHVRKYPLKMPITPPVPEPEPSIIYQNALPKPKPRSQTHSVDVHDGVPATDMNPFANEPGPSWANPFDRFTPAAKTDAGAEVGLISCDSDDESEERMRNALMRDCTDHVSVEDLLEFADQKPCGRQRGVESDEVRIMNKVLKQQVTPEHCLEALELCDWNVHYAIKVVRVKIIAGTGVTMESCRSQLELVNGDTAKAAAILARQNSVNK